MAGKSRISSGNSYYVTIKYNTTGVEKWVATYDGFSTALAIDDSGNVFVTGIVYNINTGEDYATIKYNTYGEEQWVAFYNGTQNRDDRAMAIALDDFDNVFVTGSSREIDTY